MFRRLVSFFAPLWVKVVMFRRPDVVIGGDARPYMLRWYLIPRNLFLNVYLHEFRRSDDDRALRDHPWVNLSILLAGEYAEHTIAAGGVHKRAFRRAGDFKFRLGRDAHRIELISGRCWTIFITGPRLREWGFHCEHGWVSHNKATYVTPEGVSHFLGCGESE